MPSRRTEKMAREIQGLLSGIIQQEISDPRVQGLISVTRVDLSPDFKNAKVYLSVLGVEPAKQKLCVAGVAHAGGFVRSRLAQRLEMKTCPSLAFFLDTDTAERIKTMEILDQLSDELRDPPQGKDGSEQKGTTLSS